MRIAEVEPTVFLKKRKGKLQQLCRVRLEDAAEGASCELAVFDNKQRRVGEAEIGAAPQGASTHDVFLDVAAENTAPYDLEFVLKSSGRVLDRRSMQWKKPRPWRVHVIQMSHHDVGYTDLASNVLPQHERALDEVVDMAESTRHFPDDAQFRMIVEQTWSIERYLRNAPSKRREKMVGLMRSGHVEITALFGNVTTELCGHETLARMVYPAFRLKREYGIPLVSAEHNDIPGISWGLCQVLADAGIKFFSPGLPLYYSWSGEGLPSFWDEEAVFGRTGPGAFWWVSPSGKRVLFWCNNTGCGGDFRAAMPGLPNALQKLADSDYPYDLMRWPVLGAARDNSPYIDGYAHTIKKWNEDWANPHLICSTNAKFFEDFLDNGEPELPVRHGELPGQDYPVGAMSTSHATATNRQNHARVPAAETLAAVACMATDLRYPKDTIDSAYEETLWHDEHTWGYHFPACGPTAQAAQLEKAVHAYRAGTLAHDVVSKAVARIADNVRLDTRGLHLVVFNSLSVKRTGPCAAMLREWDNCGAEVCPVPPEKDSAGVGYLSVVPLTDRWRANPEPAIANGRFRLIDLSTGKGVPFEIYDIACCDETAPYAAERLGLSLRGGASEDPVGIRREIRFIAEDVPSLGYKTYRIEPDQSSETHLAASACEAAIENEFYRIESDPATGRPARIFDKETGRDLIDGGSAYAFGDLVVRQPDTGEEFGLQNLQTLDRMTSPVSSSLAWIASAYGHPHVRYTVTLYAGIKRIDFAVRILKDPTPLLDVHLAFPFALHKPCFRYEGGLSVLDPVADYLPGSQCDRVTVQNWVKIAGTQGTILWSSLDSPVVSLGQLWPGYISPAHRCAGPSDKKHRPLREEDLSAGAIYSNLFCNNFKTNFAVSQCGSVLFRYAITSSPGDVSDTEASAFGRQATTPFETIFTEHKRERPLPVSGSFLEIDNPDVALLTFKQAEDGNGLILRLWNTAAKAARARIEIPRLNIAQVKRTNLAEEDTGEALEHDAHSFAVELSANDVPTLRVTHLNLIR